MCEGVVLVVGEWRSGMVHQLIEEIQGSNVAIHTITPPYHYFPHLPPQPRFPREIQTKVSTNPNGSRSITLCHHLWNMCNGRERMGLGTGGEASKWDAGVGVDRDGVCREGRGWGRSGERMLKDWGVGKGRGWSGRVGWKRGRRV